MLRGKNAAAAHLGASGPERAERERRESSNQQKSAVVSNMDAAWLGLRLEWGSLCIVCLVKVWQLYCHMSTHIALICF